MLTVRYPQSRPVPRNKLTVDLAAFHVQFDVAPNQREYVINLDRLWFWNLLPKSTQPGISAGDGAAEVVINYRRERTPVLPSCFQTFDLGVEDVRRLGQLVAESCLPSTDPVVVVGVLGVFSGPWGGLINSSSLSLSFVFNHAIHQSLRTWR